MKFSDVTQVFEQIEQTSARLEITQLLADLLKRASSGQASIICTISLGQLHPPYIGTQFNFAEKSLVPVVADILDIEDAIVRKKVQIFGDLGDVLATGNWTTREELTVSEVYKHLCDIEKISGIGSQEEKAAQLKKLFLDLGPSSARYVARIVLGKLRLGFSDMTLIDALSWMEVGDKSLRSIIENAYNVCADIGFIASTLKEDGIKALEKMHAQVGIPIRPAAAERLPTAKAIIEKIGTCIAQPKLDGFRLQIHIDNTGKKPEIYFFSRHLTDMSDMFPDLVKPLQDLKVDTLIAEGEAIGYDPNTGSFLPFQETVKRKRKYGIEAAIVEFPLKLFLFDILYLNGKELLDLTHEERRAKMLKLMKGFKHDAVQVVEEVELKNAQELKDYFTAAIAAGLEGLVVKRPDSVYQPGKRNFNWIKLKRQEEGHLEDTIDCVILGYYSGAGKRAAFGIGAFLVGVYNKKEDLFQTVAKVGTGLTDEKWKELKKKCDAVAVKTKPRNVECAKELTPDQWTAPEIVCVVRADEITRSPVHTAGKTEKELGSALRFPRFMGYREDKGPEETTTVKEIKRLYEDQFVK